jgi:hypothetical protein
MRRAMIEGLVTTIIPVWNRARLLAEAAGSVLTQTYRPIEIIIVDDGSTDDTSAVADRLAAEHPDIIRVIHQRNRGVGAAREAGRLAARGEFIQHLDSDDLLLPRKFEVLVRTLRERPDCGIAYGRSVHRNATGDLIACDWKPLMAGEETIFPYFLRARMWETVTPLYRASVLAQAGPWTTLRLEEDWEYDCRIGALGTRLVFIDEEVAEIRFHSDNQLSRGEALDPERLRDRAAAEILILGHARRAGIVSDAPEMQHFARALFLLARQCGAAGLAEESQRLFAASRDAAGARSDRWQYRMYGAFARVAGWRTAGTISCAIDALRWR